MKNPTLRKSGRGEAEAAVKRGGRYLAEGRLNLAKAAVAQARHLARSAYPAKWTQALLGGDVAHLQVLIDQAERRVQAHVNPRLESGIETCEAPVGAGSFFRVRVNGKTHYIRAPKGTRIEAVDAALFRSGFLGVAPYVLSPVRARKNPLHPSVSTVPDVYPEGWHVRADVHALREVRDAIRAIDRAKTRPELYAAHTAACAVVRRVGHAVDPAITNSVGWSYTERLKAIPLTREEVEQAARDAAYARAMPRRGRKNPLSWRHHARMP